MDRVAQALDRAHRAVRGDELHSAGRRSRAGLRAMRATAAAVAGSANAVMPRVETTSLFNLFLPYAGWRASCRARPARSIAWFAGTFASPQ